MREQKLQRAGLRCWCSPGALPIALSEHIATGAPTERMMQVWMRTVTRARVRRRTHGEHRKISKEIKQTKKDVDFPKLGAARASNSNLLR